ncbi:MAG: alanine racemase [Acidimicrobiales bacterium]|jgi:alanine racemase
MSDRILTASELTIDLGRIRANYRLLMSKVDGPITAAMVKANGYGLGAVEVAATLAVEGCAVFFVAHLSEGIEVRAALPGAQIHVLNGAMPGTERELEAHGLIPVLNSLAQITTWRALGDQLGRALPATVHLDTGMSRLGLPPDETEQLLVDPSLLDGLDVVHVMSHLASADVPGSDQSGDQLALFRQLRSSLTIGTASLANSSGIFLGPEYHFDLVRPGIALYGGNPTPDQPNPMSSVATLEAPILQVRPVDIGDVVGYGATHTVERVGRIATIAVGYADGFLRSGSGTGVAHLAGHAVPIAGRISMDLITIDVTDVPDAALWLGAPVELIGDRCPIDEVADRAGSIANELLTDLGRRYQIAYVN